MLADWVVQFGCKYGYKVMVFDKLVIEELGLYVLLVVNWGSEEFFCFIVMEYQLKGVVGLLFKVGLVGKGVIFDIGGVFIKFFINMYYMKSDMGGVVVVLGIMEVVV